MFLNISLITLGILSIIYDIVLLLVCPGTFFNILFTFRHIWLIIGLLLIYISVFRLKTGKKFWTSLSKKTQRVILIIAVAGLIIYTINLFYILTPETASRTDTFDYIILLGGGIDKNGKLPVSVQLRAKKASEVLLLNPEAICVVTGGQLQFVPYPEAPALKAEVIKYGISENSILIEDKALDTIQNFKYSAKLLSDYSGKSVSEILESRICVVTSRYHLARSLRLAKRMGFTNVRGAGSKTSKLTVLHNYVKEICSWIKLNLRIFFTGEPKKISTIEK
jgi:uncharacterized SAM-binding protein YcdF (DUF218 family)